MIPLKLKIRNFLAYRDPEPLDFSGLHLACLAGPNGAGKSSLLDAMTWALWGKARARRDDDLIHGDETEMEVCFSFLMDGNCYQVRRYRSRKGRGRSELHFEVQDGDGWRALTGATIRETEEAIRSVLRLDYDTFINSAFLMQGRADEFTQKTPGERKAILSEILGLDVWNVYETRAKERLRRIENEMRQFEATLRNIDDELDREETYRLELEQAQARCDELAAQIAEAESYVHELEDARRELRYLDTRHAEYSRQVHEGQEALRQIEEDREAANKELADHSAILAQRDEIEAGIAQLEAARRTDQDMSERLMAQSGLQERLSELEQVITSERSRLQAELDGLRQQHTKHARLVDTVEKLEQTLAEAREELSELEARQAERDAWNEQVSKLQEEAVDLRATNRALEAEARTLLQQWKQIEAAQEAICPLCEQELSPAHRADLLARLERDGTAKKNENQANRKRLAELETAIKQLNHDLTRADGELRKLPPLRAHIATLEEQLRQAYEAQNELASVEARLAEVEDMLTGETYALEARAELAALQQQLAELGYDREAHQEARRLISELQPFERRKADLDLALKQLPQTEARIKQLEERAEAQTSRLDELCAMLDEISQEREVVALKEEELSSWEGRLQDLRDQSWQAQSKLGAAQQRLNTIATQRERRKEVVKQLDDLADEQGVYEQLRDAFGKDGIPAMIIEAAIPEIETEANELLARMTDGRMHVRFDTQREKVTGGFKETLDIKIADELGTRDYETFSGGEAFRVNFAIRLALSRLLARRAGAQLRTLIMDEGFGTQDAQGRERLVQAINAIRDDFDLILVITHIDELRDAFPVRIEVTKRPTGSVIDIV